MIIGPFSLYLLVSLLVYFSVANEMRTFARQGFSFDFDFSLQPFEGIFLARGLKRFHFIRTIFFIEFVIKILRIATSIFVPLNAGTTGFEDTTFTAAFNPRTVLLILFLCLAGTRITAVNLGNPDKLKPEQNDFHV